jgi:hypothetical protein
MTKQIRKFESRQKLGTLLTAHPFETKKNFLSTDFLTARTNSSFLPPEQKKRIDKCQDRNRHICHFKKSIFFPGKCSFVLFLRERMEQLGLNEIVTVRSKKQEKFFAFYLLPFHGCARFEVQVGLVIRGRYVPLFWASNTEFAYKKTHFDLKFGILGQCF